MDKAHDVKDVSFAGTSLRLKVDGKLYEVDIVMYSKALAQATSDQRNKFEVSPTGYGIHWPDLDEDLSIDGLIGIKHSGPLAQMQR